LKVDALGKTHELTFPDSFQKLLKKLPLNQPGKTDLFTEEGLKAMLGFNVLLLPAEGIEKKKSWTAKMDATLPVGKKAITFVYTHEGRRERGGKKLEEISFTASFTFQPAEKSSINLKHKDTKGTAFFDNAAGRLVEL